jgi:hypothetical protein
MSVMARALPLVALATIASLPAQAQETPPSVITQQRGGTYVEPPANVDPLYVPSGPNAPAVVPGTAAPLSLQLALDLPLRGNRAGSLGRATQGSTATSATVQARLRWTPLAGSYWFGQVAFYRYLRRDQQQPWNPDFSYAFGYDDPHPGTWSLFYANYTGTRWQPDANEGRFNFPDGQWTLAYRFDLPARLHDALLVGDGDAARCSAAFNLTPRYVDFATGARRHRKESATLGCRYTRPEGWYAELALYAWPARSQQQPWDPDYTYGFGWQDTGPGHFAVRYSNYSGNRYPGRTRGAGEGTLRSGSITLSWDVEW